ncbi:MAG: methyltransferase domain-containing protein [Burkholderiales bacterium]|nr:methyltransferase domain-containing protein [Burkholderiales bacterium]
MFFPKKITSIRPQDNVLEIGPGSTPHPRSNAFLEFNFNTHLDKISQRGGVAKEPVFGHRPVYYYDGGKFPFEDNQFDYVICSHVVEHVSDPAEFLHEIFRVGSGRGYLEYPLITYEYMYNFKVHLHFVKFDFDLMVLRYLPKSDTTFSEFAAVSALFNKTLEHGWSDLCAANKMLFFEGFEFHRPFAVEKTYEIEKLLPHLSFVVPKKAVRKFIGQVLNKLGL